MLNLLTKFLFFVNSPPRIVFIYLSKKGIFMPNGISCAYFALKNYEVAKEDENVFRGGIAGIQAIRTIDAATSTVSALPAATVMSIGGKAQKIKAPAGASFGSTLPPVCQKAEKCLSSLAKTGRKLVYPLIALSGVLNTIRSKDKVKTGVSQATGIGLMYAAETVAEKLLVPLSRTIENKCATKPALKALWAVARGIVYVSASLSGYEIGNRIAAASVDKIRANKLEKTKEKFDTINTTLPNQNENVVFSGMKLD